MSKPMPPTTCAHCSTKVDVPPHQNLYWRCGVCRRINGRPAYARGCVSACLRCGWCYFYGSRLTHAAATVLLATIVLGGLCWALPTVSRDYALLPRCAAWSAALALSACAVGSFFAAARSAPGGVPRKSREAWACELRALLPEDERAGLSAARLPWCDVCDNLKPPRTHHCSTCSACVVRMDHHCGFLHNCVGAANHGAFLRLLVAVLAGTGFVFGYALLELRAIYAYRGGGDLSPRALAKSIRAARGGGAADYLVAVLRHGAAARDGRYACLGCLAFGVLLGVALLLGIYANLAFAGETSLERSQRLYRGGRDYRTRPRWRGLRTLGRGDARALGPAAILAELVDAGFFRPDAADDDAVGFKVA